MIFAVGGLNVEELPRGSGLLESDRWFQIQLQCPLPQTPIPRLKLPVNPISICPAAGSCSDA